MKNNGFYVTLALLGIAACSTETVPAIKQPFVAEEIVIQPNGDLKFRGLVLDEDLTTGDWILKNGSEICDGYLTRSDSNDFCAATVPDDWVPFEYDGQIYYLQPLAAQAGSQ